MFKTAHRCFLLAALFFDTQGATVIGSVQRNPDALARQVTIYRDVYGVPHVFGPD